MVVRRGDRFDLLVILSVLAVFGMRFMKHEIEIEKAAGAARAAIAGEKRQ